MAGSTPAPKKSVPIRWRAVIWIIASILFLDVNVHKMIAIRHNGGKPPVPLCLIVAFWATVLVGWSYVAFRDWKRGRDAVAYREYGPGQRNG